MTDGEHVDRRREAPVTRLRGELLQFAVALVLGLVLAVALLGGVSQEEVWRVVILPAALLLIVRALHRLIQLGRAEWRREGTAVRAYLGVVVRFVLAYLMIVTASS